MRIKRALAMLLCAMLALIACATLLPGTARAAAPFADAVTLYPGGTAQTLDSANPYFVNNAATSGSHTLGQGGCTAYFHNGILEIQGLRLSGAALVGGDAYSAMYVAGSLTIRVHGDNTVTMPDGTGKKARAIFMNVGEGALTLDGNGSLRVSTGNGYTDGASAAISCGSVGSSLTVDSGVTLTAGAGTSAGTSAGVAGNVGLYINQLINHGRIYATGQTAGIWCCASTTPLTSANDGMIAASATNGPGLRLSSGATFAVNGGTVELTGANGEPAVGGSTIGIVQLAVGPAITSGSMGTSRASASVYPSRQIVEHYAAATRSNAYLRLPAIPGDTTEASVPETGDATPLPLLCGVVLFCGAGLLMRRRRRGRGQACKS